MAITIEIGFGSLQWCVRSRVTEVKKEGVIGMAIDKGDGFFGKDIGKVFIYLDSLPPAVDCVIGRSIYRRPTGPCIGAALRQDLEKLGTARQHPEVLIKAAAHWMILLLLSQVPLANHACGVTTLTQFIGYRNLVQCNPVVRIPASRIKFPAMPLLVATG